MPPKYKYDIAFSVAEEDLSVALQIAEALRKEKIRYYLYKEHDTDWGNDLIKITLETFTNSRYVLMITSSVSAEKHWSGIENMIAQARNEQQPHILPLRLDDTPIKGLSPYKIFRWWNNNPEEIARIISKKVKTARGATRLPFIRVLLLTVLITAILMTSIYSWNTSLPNGSPTGDSTRMEATFKRCQAMTTKGTQCKNKAKDSGKYCGIHLKMNN
jgi:hypothetical protein